MSEKTITIEEVISKVDRIKPNAYTNEDKTEWINAVEGKIQTEIMGVSLANVVAYDYEIDSGKPLLVVHPYSDIYEYFVEAMIDFFNKEYGDYQNDTIMFNSSFKDYTSYYKRTHAATSAPYIKNIW